LPDFWGTSLLPEIRIFLAVWKFSGKQSSEIQYRFDAGQMQSKNVVIFSLGSAGLSITGINGTNVNDVAGLLIG
jgi:hypothetical protein